MGKLVYCEKCGRVGSVMFSRKCKSCGIKQKIIPEEMTEKYNIFTHDWCVLYSKIGYSIPVENSKMIEELLSRERNFIMNEVAGNPLFSMEAYEKQVEEDRERFYRTSEYRINSQIELMHKNLGIKEEANGERSYTPLCPICGSRNLEKISFGTRALKTAVFGTAGAIDDAGKTYKCGNCGSKF